MLHIAGMSVKRLRLPKHGPRVWLMVEMSIPLASVLAEMAKRYEIEPGSLVRMLIIEALEARENRQTVKIKGSQVLIENKAKNISAQQ